VLVVPTRASVVILVTLFIRSLFGYRFKRTFEFSVLSVVLPQVSFTVDLDTLASLFKEASDIFA